MKYIQNTSLTSQLILIWNNPKINFKYNHIFGDNKFTESLSIDIIIYPQSQNSLSNRWMIAKYHKSKTQSAMFIDDYIYATKERIPCLLNVWKQHKNNIVSSKGYRTLQPIFSHNYIKDRNDVDIRL